MISIRARGHSGAGICSHNLRAIRTKVSSPWAKTLLKPGSGQAWNYLTHPGKDLRPFVFKFEQEKGSDLLKDKFQSNNHILEYLEEEFSLSGLGLLFSPWHRDSWRPQTGAQRIPLKFLHSPPDFALQMI